jgi:hypothetical protein
MHGHNEAEFLRSVAGFLGGYYLMLAALNGTAALYLWRSGKARPLCSWVAPSWYNSTAFLWLLLAGIFGGIVSPLAFSGDPSGWDGFPFPPRCVN